MTETNITFKNQAEIRVQAQIFTGRTLVSTSVAGPGEVCSLPITTAKYDVFFKDAATGWEIARKLNSELKSFTLSREKGRYVLR